MHVRMLSRRTTYTFSNEMKDYWTSETEEALAEYVRTEDMDERNRLFDEHIHIPLKKLIDDVVKRYKPCAGEVDEDIKLDILTYVVMYVGKFNPEATFRDRKVTAWSYCNVLARCWIADFRMRTSREKKNVRFQESHEVHLNKIQ